MTKKVEEEFSETEAVEAAETEAPKKRIIAEWIGDASSPRLEGATARAISKKDAKLGEWEIPNDLKWEHANHYRQDISDVPPSFREMLEKDKSFKITEE